MIELLTWWFFLLNPSPQLGILSVMSSLSRPSSPIGFLIDNTAKYEIGTGLKVSFAKIGFGVEGAGNLNLDAKIRIRNKNLIEFSITSVKSKEPYGFNFISLGLGRFFNFKKRKFLSKIYLSYVSYYELYDRYTFTDIGIETIYPFYLKKYFQPFIGAQFEYTRYGFPENIRKESLRGLILKIITGINFKYKNFNLHPSIIWGRGNLDISLTLSFLFTSSKQK